MSVAIVFLLSQASSEPLMALMRSTRKIIDSGVLRIIANNRLGNCAIIMSSRKKAPTQAGINNRDRLFINRSLVGLTRVVNVSELLRIPNSNSIPIRGPGSDMSNHAANACLAQVKKTSTASPPTGFNLCAIIGRALPLRE